MKDGWIILFFLLLIAGAVLFGIMKAEPQSGMMKIPASQRQGDDWTFHCLVPYTVDRHEAVDGQETVVCTSDNEPWVEIRTGQKELVSLPDGTKFIFAEPQGDLYIRQPRIAIMIPTAEK